MSETGAPKKPEPGQTWQYRGARRGTHWQPPAGAPPAKQASPRTEQPVAPAAATVSAAVQARLVEPAPEATTLPPLRDIYRIMPIRMHHILTGVAINVRPDERARWRQLSQWTIIPAIAISGASMGNTCMFFTIVPSEQIATAKTIDCCMIDDQGKKIPILVADSDWDMWCESRATLVALTERRFQSATERFPTTGAAPALIAALPLLPDTYRIIHRSEAPAVLMDEVNFTPKDKSTWQRFDNWAMVPGIGVMPVGGGEDCMLFTTMPNGFLTTARITDCDLIDDQGKLTLILIAANDHDINLWRENKWDIIGRMKSRFETGHPPRRGSFRPPMGGLGGRSGLIPF